MHAYSQEICFWCAAAGGRASKAGKHQGSRRTRTRYRQNGIGHEGEGGRFVHDVTQIKSLANYILQMFYQSTPIRSRSKTSERNHCSNVRTRGRGHTSIRKKNMPPRTPAPTPKAQLDRSTIFTQIAFTRRLILPKAFSRKWWTAGVPSRIYIKRRRIVCARLMSLVCLTFPITAWMDHWGCFLLAPGARGGGPVGNWNPDLNARAYYPEDDAWLCQYAHFSRGDWGVGRITLYMRLGTAKTQ
jgi:hypothetical protein